MTYNLFLRPIFVKNKASDYKKERLKDFKHELLRFDIICTQETFMGLTEYKGKLLKYGLEGGLVHTACSKTPGLFTRSFIDNGLMIFSRYPIVEQDEITYSNYLLIDIMAKKGVLFVKI